MSYPHKGDFSTSSGRTFVIHSIPTFDRSGGNVAPSSAFESADLRIYRGNSASGLSATQRSSANGITMTSPFDSLTGTHTIGIDLTDDTDSGFYASGYYYEVWLCPDETVDSQTLTGVPLCSFTIGLPDQVNVTQLLGTAWLTPGTAGTPDVNVKLISGDSGAADALESLLDGTEAVDLTEFIRLASAVLGGKTSGMDTGTPIIRNPADTKDVVTASCDEDGNRNSVTLDLS